MNTIAFAIEGVLAKEQPASEFFSVSTPIREGIDLYLEMRRPNTILVTGVEDRDQVEHWLRSQQIFNATIEYCTTTTLPEVWQRRLMALERLGSQFRGNLMVVESARIVRDALVGQGVTVLQPWFGRRKVPVEDDEFIGLRRQWATWED